MRKKSLTGIVVIVMLLVGLYFFFPSGEKLVEQPRPVIEDTNQESSSASPETQTAAQLAKDSSSSDFHGEQTVRLRLSPASSGGSDSAYSPADFSYSIKRENKEVEILPGVTYAKRSVCIKTANKDETVQLQRQHLDNSNTDYRVLWQKKY